MATPMSRSVVLTCFLSALTEVSSFILLPHQQSKITLHRPSFLTSSSGENNGIDEMRRLLEASWDVDTMGSVPTNAESAADAAATAVTNAIGRSETGLFYVDLLLPQYDIRQGSNLYDEVLAVEFCIELSKRLKGKSAIVVRDEKTIKTVSRILDARVRDREVSLSERAALDVGEGDDADEEEDDDDDESPPFFDDFAGVDTIVGDLADVESFREQLISGWNNEGLASDGGPEGPSTSPVGRASPASYRVTSMLGSETISGGADMFDQVVRAVSLHAQPRDDEGTIIILSAVSTEEMIGVRGLVSKFSGKKTIIFVNCNFNPPPRELMRAQTVYNIQPFIARPKVSETNLFASDVSEQQTNQKPPKVVLMRRFPRDWEIFIDIGSGFELARTIPANQVDNKTGPPMQQIASCVKQYMQTRLG